MSGVACPRCAEPVRLPEAAPGTQVRCPWCRESYGIDEVIGRLPPMLEVVDTTGHGMAGVTPAPRWSGEGPAFAAAGASAPALETLAGGLDTRDTRMPYPSARNGGRNGGRRRSSLASSLMSVVRVAAGGIVGCFLALLILQSVGRLPDLGFWPFRGPEAEWWGTAEHRRDNDRGGAFRGFRPGPAPMIVDDNQNTTPMPEVRLGDPADLELPAFPLDSEPEDSPVHRLVEQADSALARYETESAQTDDAGRDASDMAAETAEELAGLLRRAAEAGSEAGGLVAVDRARVDALVGRLRDELPLLKELAARGGGDDEDAEDQEPGRGVILFGLVDGQPGAWRLKRSGADPAPYRLELDESLAAELQPGRLVTVLGTRDADGAIQVIYARALSRSRGDGG